MPVKCTGAKSYIFIKALVDCMLENCCSSSFAVPRFTQNLPSHQYNGDTVTYSS